MMLNLLVRIDSLMPIRIIGSVDSLSYVVLVIAVTQYTNWREPPKTRVVLPLSKHHADYYGGGVLLNNSLQSHFSSPAVPNSVDL